MIDVNHLIQNRKHSNTVMMNASSVKTYTK